MNQAFQWNEKTPEVTAAFQQFKKDVDRLMKPFTETVCLEASDALYELVAMTQRKRLKQKSGHVWYYCRLRIGGEACDKRLHDHEHLCKEHYDLLELRSKGLQTK